MSQQVNEDMHRTEVDRESARPSRRLLVGAAALALLSIGTFVVYQSRDDGVTGQPPVEVATSFIEAYGAFDAERGGMVDIEAAMARLDPAAPQATIIFYRSLVLASDTAPVTALQEALTARGMAVLPIFVRSLKDAASSAVVAKSLAARRPDVILNLTAFSAATGQDGRGCLDAADESAGRSAVQVRRTGGLVARSSC